MPDGVRLAARMWLPADADEQVPSEQRNVILGVTGYLQPYGLILP